MKTAELNELARSGSPENIGDMITALTELFMKAGRQERSRVSPVLGDVVLRVLDRLDVSVRKTMAARMCAETEAPRDLLKALAKDSELEVARPVMTDGGLLTDEDLAEVAQEGIPVRHLDVMCERQGIKPVLSRVLAQKGDSPVLCALLGNETARITADSFDLLLARSRKDEELQAALTRRQDLPEQVASKLVPFLSKELIQQVREENANPVLAKVVAEQEAREVEIRLREIGGAKSKIDLLIEGAIAGTIPIDQAVVVFADKDRAFDLGKVLAGRVGWPENVVVPLVYREDEHPLFVLSRIAGVSNEAYVKLVRMRGKKMRLSSASASESSRRYGSLTLEAARTEFIAMARKMKLPVEIAQG
ncbi:DUF2336 domain-containing protein [Stappia sp. 28M-7]|uniref:DUF2336 domain-containing protein n=1 Tax=Stappia sp. 28M-7 TaxID=2762596 RepID=UPI000E76896F|nr:DUF2336 domain-containing protein [Stappia sp. 28M-7]MBC2860492.1 DUF2336 domain-containing protein [Stappia sp. 28M-7]